MSDILKGVRPLDYVLAGVMTAAGVLLMYENITAGDDPSLPHPVSTTSWLIVPVFLLTTLPILWRRRNVLAVVGVTTVATAVHVLAFGWLTRCGVLLPVSIALAYAVARFAGSMRNHLIGLAGVVIMQLVLVVRDSSIDHVVNALPLSLPAAAVFYGIGLYVQNRVSAKRQAAAVTPVAERTTV
jgi:hypothetical protein